MASDWALWKLWLIGDAGASSEQLDAWIDKLSEPGGAEMFFAQLYLQNVMAAKV
jgi:hypothetical protein